MDSAKPVGLVGLIGAGAAIARLLSRQGRRVLVWERDPLLTRELAKDRPAIEIAGSLFDIGAECDVVLVRAATMEALTAAVFGTEERPGFGHTLEPDSIIIDLEPKDPRETRRLMPVLGLKGISIVDAVVLGSETATPCVLAGGFAPTVERVLPLLGSLGHATRAGELGAAHALSILAGAVRETEKQARQEAEAVLRALHIDPSGLAGLVTSPGQDGGKAALLLARALAERTDTAAPLFRAAAVSLSQDAQWERDSATG